MSPGLLAGRLFCLFGRRTKTTGPALALADNANLANGEDRFHARVIARGPVAVKTHCPGKSVHMRSGNILLNLYILNMAKVVG